jgi:nucleoside-triphosphatase THEP1
MHDGDNLRILVLSGASGCGKTTICLKVTKLARDHGWSLQGVLTLPRCDQDQKVGLDVQDVMTGDVRPLAEVAGVTDGPSTGRFHFYSKGIRWANEILSRVRPCDLFILDELGPLELRSGQGWNVGLDVLRTGVYKTALVVVRPTLLDRFAERLDGMAMATLDVTVDNRNELPRWIVDLCGRKKESVDD